MQHAKDIKTILIIEDDPFISMDLEDIFESEGYEVLGPFAEVDAGLKILKERTPDVAMLDFNLGQETSIPLARELHSKNIPYAFLSGQIKSVIIDTDLPPRPVLLKPFVPEHLVTVVETLIQ